MLTLHKVHEPILNIYLFSTVSNYFQFMIGKLKLTLLGLGGVDSAPRRPYQTFLDIF